MDEAFTLSIDETVLNKGSTISVQYNKSDPMIKSNSGASLSTLTTPSPAPVCTAGVTIVVVDIVSGPAVSTAVTPASLAGTTAVPVRTTSAAVPVAVSAAPAAGNAT
jgi:hypothetical protein